MFARLETITQMARSCWSVAVQTCRQPDSCYDLFSLSGGKILYYFIWSDTKNWSSKTTICFAACNGSPAPRAKGMQHAAGEAAARSPEQGATALTYFVSLGLHRYHCLATSKRMLQCIAINQYLQRPLKIKSIRQSEVGWHAWLQAVVCTHWAHIGMDPDVLISLSDIQCLTALWADVSWWWEWGQESTTQAEQQAE